MIIELLYRWRVSDSARHAGERKPNELYVTDLVYCPLRYRYQAEYRELALASSFSPATLLGTLAHSGFGRVLEELFGDKVRLEVDYGKSVKVDGDLYVVVGRVDAVVGDTVVEFKTARSDASIPQEQHVLQVRVYLWLTGLRKGIILYATPDRVAEYEVQDPATDEEVARLVRETVTGRPAPRYQWECRYCAFSVICPRKVSER